MLRKDVVDDARANQPPKEVMDHDPLVVPADGLLGELEEVLRLEFRMLGED